MLGKQTLLRSEKSSNDSFVFREQQNRLDPKQMGFCHLQRPLGKKRLYKDRMRERASLGFAARE